MLFFLFFAQNLLFILICDFDFVDCDVFHFHEMKFYVKS